jgi:hypothetical protein
MAKLLRNTSGKEPGRWSKGYKKAERDIRKT